MYKRKWITKQSAKAIDDALINTLDKINSRGFTCISVSFTHVKARNDFKNDRFILLIIYKT